MQVYNAINGQSIFDVCLQTYGGLDFLSKLMVDNGFPNMNSDPYSGQAFVFDESLIVDQLTNAGNRGTKLATLLSPAKVDQSGSDQLTLITKRYATSYQAPTISSPIEINNMYQTNDTDSYTAGADGETSVSLPAWIGWDVLYVEDDIKPLKKSEYAWNKSSGTFTLQGGLSLNSGQTLFFIFKQMVSA